MLQASNRKTLLPALASCMEVAGTTPSVVSSSGITHLPTIQRLATYIATYNNNGELMHVQTQNT